MSIETLQPAEWARPKGYANGMAARGRMIFISGQVGWDEQGHFASDNLAEQVKQALRNIVRVLKEAQALCMKTDDFRRAYEAFSAKQRPTFKGN